MRITEQQLKDIIMDIIQIDESKIQQDSSFVRDLGMDSLQIADLVSSLEEDYDIIVEVEALPELKTVGMLMEHINRSE